jgi:hypothetical protein
MGELRALIPPVIADNPVLSAFWMYWQSKRSSRSVPCRSDIDPIEIPQLLRHIQLVDKIGPRLRYRLCGTAIVEAYGCELTGKFLDEVIPAHRCVIAEQHYALVYDSRRPLFVKHKYITTKSVDIVSSRVILPLSEKDGEVRVLAIAQTFDYGAQAAVRLGIDATLEPYHGQIEFL